MKFTVKTRDGELTFQSFGEVERAWLMGLVEPDDEVLEAGHTKWRRAGSIPLLAKARRTGEQAWGGAWFLTAVVAILAGSVALYYLKQGEWLIGGVLALVTGSVTVHVAVRAARRAKPHG